MGNRKVLGWLVWMGVILLQLIMTQVVTFLASLIPPGMENIQAERPLAFVLLLGWTFTLGVFLAGWLGIGRGWLPVAPRYPARLAWTLFGAYAPLVLGVLLFQTLEAGSPFFALSIFLAILGFHLPSWLGKR